MSKLEDMKLELDRRLDDLKREFDKEIKEARLLGFEEGMSYKNDEIPTDAKFRKDHKEVVDYGEDYCAVVACRSRKTASKLLDCDEEYVEQVGVGWKAYELDGEIHVGYYMGREVEPKWYAWGIYI